MRTIMHVDMDAFFAAVEVLDHPEYAGKPLIIGGRKDSPRGVVSTASYEARKYGVHSAMPIAKAAMLCPHGIFIPGRMQRYQEVSKDIHAIFPEFSPLVEPLSIDEAFLDMSGCEHFYPSLEEMGHSLKRRIKDKTGVTASVGIAPNKFLAKLASDWQKPDGLFVLRPDEVDDFLRDVPVGRLWGVGAKSEAACTNSIRYVTISCPIPCPAAGKGGGPWVPKSITYRGLTIERLCLTRTHSPLVMKSPSATIRRTPLCANSWPKGEKVDRLRQEGFYARTVSIKVRFYDFRTITRSHTLEYSFNDDDTIFGEALHLLEQIKLQPVRLLGVTVSNLSIGAQLSLFSTQDQSASQVNEVMDSINPSSTWHDYQRQDCEDTKGPALCAQTLVKEQLHGCEYHCFSFLRISGLSTLR